MSVTSDRTEPEARAGNANPLSRCCPQCGGAISGRAVDGLCARCLMQLASESFEHDAPNANDSATGSLPDCFGRYTIRRKLGQGAMGVVYLAKDGELGRLVALKLPLFGRSSEAAVVERFQREIRAAASVQHPNICPIYDVGQIDGTLFMTMAFIEGRTLSRVLEEQAVLSMSQAVTLVRKLALALHAAHQRGIVHRDLKPANIMIDRRGEPIIMDFGLARRRDTDDARVTTSGAVVGTPAYMSPEQVAGIEATGASDVYSLGVILYELVAGRLPLDGELVPLLNKIAHESPAPPSAYGQDVPQAIDHICLKALAKDPEDRFGSAEELARVLTRFLIQVDATSTSSTVGRPSRTTRPSAKTDHKSKQQMRMLVGTAVTTVVLTLLILAAFVYFTDSPPASPTMSEDAVNALADRMDSSGPLAPLEQPQVAQKEDVVVNYVLGRYLCFTERDWQRGLQYLARGADETLQRLAKQDLTASAAGTARTAAQALSVADAWAAFAGEQKLDSTRIATAERAKYWYELSLDGLNAINRDRVETWLRASDGSESHLADGSSKQQATAISTDVDTAESLEHEAMMARLSTALPFGLAESDVDFASSAESGQSLNRFEQRCLTMLGGVGQRRLKMLAEMKQLVNQRDVQLPKSHLQASADYAQLVRLGTEIAEEIRVVNLRQGELLRMQAMSDNDANRRTMEFQLSGLRRERAIAMQRIEGLTVEAKGKRLALAELSGKMKAVNEQIIDWSDRAEYLIEEAFWSLEPGGSLSRDAYQEIAVLLTRWLHTTEMHPAILTLRALAYCHCGQVEEAAADADEAALLDPSFVLAIAVRGYVRFREGGAGEGITEMSRAIRLDGKQPAPYLMRGLAYRARGNDAAAWHDFERVTALAGEAATGHALLALQLAASRDESVRDGQAAVAAAERACQLSDRQSWFCLAALAAAKAEIGEFDSAIESQSQACSMADQEHRRLCEERLKRIEAGQPFRLE